MSKERGFQIDVDGVRFVGDCGSKDEAFVVAPAGLVGWYGMGGTTMRREDTPRPTDHGSLYAPGYRPAKAISITGAIIARNPRRVRVMREQLEGVLADGDIGRMAVINPDMRTTHAEVGLALGAAVSPANDRSRTAAFQIGFWGPDGYLNGKLRTFAPVGVSGSIRPSHKGSIKTSMLVRVTGPFPNGYTLSYGAQRIVVTAALPAGSVDVHDTESGLATRNGSLLTTGVGRRDQFMVRARKATATLSVSGAGGSGTVAAELYDRFP